MDKLNMMTRRETLRALLFGSAIAMPGSLASGLYKTARAQTKFTNALKIPPLLNGTRKGAVRHYDLKLQQGATTFFDGLSTPTLGINGGFLGPTIRLRDGENVALNVTNRIGEPTTLHWHGLHLPAKADGGPHQVIADGATWHPAFQVKQQAATFWYHSHLLHKTGEQVYRGLAGMMIVEDEESRGLSLPSTYGLDDIPVVLQDRSFNQDGSFRYITSMRDAVRGMVGNTILVNGTFAPYLTAKSRKIRLRILNGANARFFNIGFNDGRNFHQIATDGGLLSQPFRTRRITLAPGERAEIIVDVSDGKNVTLVNLPAGSRSGGFRGMMMSAQSDERFDILEVRPSETLAESAALPATLVRPPQLRVRDAVKTRRFVLNMRMGPGGMSGGGRFTINGQAMDKSRVDETVRLGDTEIWEIKNRSPMPHPFHIHDIQFRILDRNGKPPAPGEQGLKDTVRVYPEETVRVIARFDDYADPDLPYMYHCHILEHEDGGMMGQFVVV